MPRGVIEGISGFSLSGLLAATEGMGKLMRGRLCLMMRGMEYGREHVWMPLKQLHLGQVREWGSG